MFGHSAVIKLLIDQGTVVDAGTSKGFMPLHTASYTGQMESVQLLIELRATVMA
jgi:ankyrin repeat protein